ncbi:MAG TPA: alpha amylase family protein [bacterium]|nr:alpha amylase family protein [bacterium]
MRSVRTAGLLVTTLLTLATQSSAGLLPRHVVPRLALWMEPGANLALLTTREGVDRALDRARAAGVDVVMPEAKNAWGYVTYPSAFAPTIADSPVPHGSPDGAYGPPTGWYPQGYDMLGTIIAEAHARGMRVDAAVNTFGEGYTPLRAGPAFAHPGWQAVAYLATRRVLAPNHQSYALAGENVPREEDALVLYTRAAGAQTPTSRWGVEVAVDGGAVIQVRDRTAGPVDPGAVAIPPDGYVLSGQGRAAAWLGTALPLGAKVSIGPVETRMAPSSSHSIFAFASPASPEVWNYELGIVYEIVSRYDVDGIVLDRTRYQDVSEDFSLAARQAFERFIGRSVAHWPDDVYTYVPRGYWVAREPGPLYRAWLGYRAHTIMTYTRAVVHLVHTIRPGVSVSMYVGAWYPVYYEEGVNWGSPDVRPPYSWVGDAWIQAGLAPLLDYLMIGLYYRPVTIWEAYRGHDHPEISVQGAAMLGLSVVHGATPVVGALLTSLYADDSKRLTAAIRMSSGITRGTMLFDLVYLDSDHLWGAISKP